MNTAAKRLPYTRGNFLRKIVLEKIGRNNKIYEKLVVSVIELCKRKSTYAKGNLKTFRTLRLLIYGYSVDLPFCLELYQKSYICV